LDPNHPLVVEEAVVESEVVEPVTAAQEVNEEVVDEVALEEEKHEVAEDVKEDEMETDMIEAKGSNSTEVDEGKEQEHDEVAKMAVGGGEGVVEEEEAHDIVEDKIEKTIEAEEEEESVEPIVAEAEVVVQKLPAPITSRLFSLYLVGNKYNPSNFWSVFHLISLVLNEYELITEVCDRSGRWRSHYAVDYETGVVKGEIQIRVHYWENGKSIPSYFLRAVY
jgi:capping protein alpha